MHSDETLLDIWTWCGFVPPGLKRRRARKVARELERAWQDALEDDDCVGRFTVEAREIWSRALE